MSKWIVTAVLAALVALVVISGASVSAHGGSNGGPTDRGGGGGGGRKATRTPVPTATALPATATIPSAPTSTPTPNASGGQREQQTVDFINQRRAALGLGALSVDANLVSAARRHSNDIGPAGLCQHNGRDGSSPWSRMADAGWTGNDVGEVVGCGYPSAQGVVDAWWGSPAHFDILTNAAANAVGCGWWVDAAGYGWVTCDLGWQ